MANRDSKDKDGRPEFASRLYRERLKILRKGQEYSQADNVPKAVECYNQYLNGLALYHGTEEKNLNPSYFDKEKEVAELLLISHVYWDLARAYDRNPRLHQESIRCLDQFVKFTVGFKYQYVNARMLKNFIRKRLGHNIETFKDAHKKIQVESKSCFIATHIFGHEHDITNELRLFKARIAPYYLGQIFIECYYSLSPKLVAIFNSYPKLTRPIVILLDPLLKVIAQGSRKWRS
jgi:hypothetical protein